MATLNDKTVGDIIKIKEDGASVNYIIVHKGNPDTSMYDSSCDGVWLLREQAHSSKVWEADGKSDYENSDIKSWLNGTFLNTIDEKIRAAIKTVKIPYKKGLGNVSTSVQSGSSGLSCKGFLLSGYEIGFTVGDSSVFPVDGAMLSYFLNGNSDANAKTKRICKDTSGSAVRWWLRSPDTSSDINVFNVTQTGGYGVYNSTNTKLEARPAFILPSTLSVDDEGNILTNTAPTTPTTITIPTPIYAGSSFKVSWGESTDPEGTLSGYKLERSINGGEWTQIYTGPMLEYTDTIAETGVDSLQYRVKAFDTAGVESAYKESEIITVSSAPTPTDSSSKLVNFESLKRFYQNLDLSSGGSTGGGATKVKLLGDCEIGDVVYINENNVGREYVVIQKGNPDPSIYDASCDGIWLMKEKTYGDDFMKWHNTDSESYYDSDICKFLDSEFLGSINIAIRSLIKTVKIPIVHKATNYNVYSLGEGFPCKVFCLSATEVGLNEIPNNMAVGSRLSYFMEGSTTPAGHIRRYKMGARYVWVSGDDNEPLEPEGQMWWLRSIRGSVTQVCYVNSSGSLLKTTGATNSNDIAVRPVFILPPTLYVDSDGYVTP